MSSSQSTQASSSSTVGSTSHSDFITSQKRPTTARMHAFSPRKKQRTDETQPPLPTALDQTPHGTVKANIGECPPYNDHAAWIEDAFNNTVYVFGGTRPGDEDCIPTSDFFRCDARTMKWEDLTEKLRFRDPYDPFSSTELLREKKCLPELSKPGLSLMKIENTTFIFIFGGYSVDEDKAVSDIIAVDVDHLEWWYVTIEGGNVAPRICPVVVAVKQKLYIFSGFKKFSKKECYPFKSYSIASYSPPRGWRWEARDVPYSCPAGFDHQLFGSGIAVYDGKKILLTPGRVYFQEDLKRLDFSKKKFYFFHTEHHQFQVAPHFGDFPTEVLWYSVHHPPPSRPPLPSRKALADRRASSSALTPGSSISPPPFIVLCVWIPRQNSKYAVPEFWRLSLSHNDDIRCLNKSEQIWNVNEDFQGCITAKEGITLLGNNNPKGNEKWNIHLRVILTPEDLQDE